MPSAEELRSCRAQGRCHAPVLARPQAVPKKVAGRDFSNPVRLPPSGDRRRPFRHLIKCRTSLLLPVQWPQHFTRSFHPVAQARFRPKGFGECSKSNFAMGYCKIDQARPVRVPGALIGLFLFRQILAHPELQFGVPDGIRTRLPVWFGQISGNAA